MSQTELVWFKSKVDWWLGVIIVALPLIEIAALVSAVRSGESEAVRATAGGLAIVAAVYGLLLVPIRYGLDGESLIIRFGVIRRRVALESVREVRPSRNPLSSPALSLDRLKIELDAGGYALISPADREEFLQELAARTGLSRQGDCLVRSVR